MKVLLIYYTGTYNTRFLTNKVKERFVAQGDEVDTVEINADTPICDTQGYELVGFSYPIYGFNSPVSFNKYVRKLKFSKGQKYFIYKNSGETLKLNNASSRVLKRIMRRQRAKLVGEYHYVMPYNIHFPYDRAFIREIFVKNAKLLDIMMNDLATGYVRKIKSNLIYNTGSFFVGIQKIGGDINSYFYKVLEDKCIHCNKCVSSCPRHNVYVKDGKIKFHHHCDMCMRCSFFCPTDAIRIGFLDSWGWRVNGDYGLEKIEADTSPIEPYITPESKGFYKCFIKSFAMIDAEHERLFGKSKEEEQNEQA